MAVRARKRLVLSTIERERLAKWAVRPGRGRAAVRAAIILACAEGQPDTRIAAQAGVSRATVAKWRARFMAARLAGLRDAPRPGTPRKITDAQVRDVLARTLSEPPPAGRDHWTTRTMAAASGLSQSAVSRIWRSAGVDPASCTTGGTGDNEGVGMELDGTRQSGQISLVATPPGNATGIETMELPARRFLDREESWLGFNQRVLELAEDDRVPLLERVKFVAIFASNLDEFFMVRVAGRIRRMATGLPVESASGLLPRQILQNTLQTARELARRHAECFSQKMVPALASVGIEILRWKELSATEQDELHKLFRDRVYPVLTPLVVDPAHPFPYISGLSLSLAVMNADPKTGGTMFARVKVPPLLPRFLTVGQHRFVPLEDVIAAHLDELFVGLDVLEQHAFRVTRTRDLEIDEDVTEDLLQSLERELMRRRFEPAVRLEVEESISSDVLDKLVTELGIDSHAVYRVPGPLDLSGLMAIADLELNQLKYPAFVPSEAVLPQDTSIFTALTEHDVLVHHPYDSFTTTVERLVVSAAADPRVLAIKHTLYRTSGDSQVVDALIDAAEAGKQVVVVVEIKARFDERANIAWARKLEEAGCHVVYGFVGLKTHAKLML